MKTIFCFRSKQRHAYGIFLEVFFFPHCGFLNKYTSVLSKHVCVSKWFGSFFPTQPKNINEKTRVSHSVSVRALLIVGKGRTNKKRSGAPIVFVLLLKYLMLVALFLVVYGIFWKFSTVWSSCEVPLHSEGGHFPETADKSDQVQGHLIWNLEKGHRAVGFSSVALTYASLNRK